MVQVTILNDIVDSDFAESLAIQKQWGIQVLDLRGGIFGKSFMELSGTEAAEAVKLIQQHELSVYCLSSGLFYDVVEKGEQHFREQHLGKVDTLIEAAKRFDAKVVRLLSAETSERAGVTNAIAYVQETAPWLISLYREAIDRIHAAGIQVTIENEVKNNILTTPEEVLDFFTALERQDKISFTFDVQNLWKMGTFPTLEVYDKLQHLIGYYHLKGGLADDEGDTLVWKSSLEDADWPVAAMTAKLAQSGRCPVICLNPSHGEFKPGYDYEDLDKRNLDFLRTIPGIQ